MRRKAVIGVLVLIGIVGVIVVSAIGAANGPAPREPQSAASAGVVGSPAAATQRAQERVIAYWTPERMRNAKPMALGRPTNAPVASGVASSGPSGPAQSVPGSAPVSKSEPPLAQTRVGGTETMGYTYPFPFTRHAVDGSYLRYPYRTIGKMFFTQGGGNFVCSGASVVSSPNNVVYTAGHCVSNGAGGFSTNVLFVPARKVADSPYGIYPGTQLWTTSAWHFSGDLTRDFGAFVVGTNLLGHSLQSRVGSLGFQFDQSRVQHWDAFGYPAAGGFSGEAQITCKASHGADDTAIPGGGPDPMGIGCDMTGGSSGGPWITMFQRGSFLNSVNSYKYPSTQPDAMYGPYFDILANQVRCAAATGGSTTC